ncbi:MAG: glycerophosphodiester phosphodiesterase family protein [Alphaproteobacteria bacterium]|nr:glycerophosphodiester phosphodiesterase family protein [Alphaproteobacteria bacterium]
MDIDLPLVMGHRGAAAWAPENTLASIRKAAELGASWVEFDVMLTGDGRPVLFHDDNLKRVTGLDALMADTSYAKVNKLDAGRWFAAEFAGERVPPLEAALDLVWQLGLRPNIEIKSTPGRDVETAQAALEIATRAWNRRRPAPLISSFSRMSLAAARVLRPDWPRGLIAHKVPLDWQLALTALGCSSFHLNSKCLTWEFVAQVKSAGYKVAAFTVNQKQRARELIDCNVDCLITDVPDRIAAALEARAERSASGLAVDHPRR